MSDLFHEGVSDAYIAKVCEVMLTANWHTYQILTKRPQRMEELLGGPLREAAEASHILWGVSVEDQRYGLPRIEALRRARVRNAFLSIEPLLEDLGQVDLREMSWVIVGGESGPGARPMHPDWARTIRDQCKEAKVPFFFKQWGGFQKKKAGRVLDGMTHDEFPLVTSEDPPPLHVRQELLKRLKVE